MAEPRRAGLSELAPRLVGWSVAGPKRMLAIGLALLVAALAVAATRFDMTTDTAALISPTVAWRQQERATEAAFPQLADSMLIVVDGATPELAEAGAAGLAQRLGVDRRHFRRVTRPDGGDFFAREGLLFEDRAAVRRSTAALVQAQPLLGPLAADPSLRGVAGALGTGLDGVAAGQTSLASLAQPIDALAAAGERVLAGKPAFFSWQRLFAGGDQALSPPTRRLVLAQPVLDHAALQPGAAAADAAHAAAAALRLDAAHGVTVRLTGEVPLADEEFATLQENIGAVGALMGAAMLVTLWWATRSAKLVLAITATTIVGLVVTAALGLLAVGRYNLISIAFIPLFVGLGVDFGIQLSIRWLAERGEGADPADAMHRAARALGPSLLLAAGAVFLGFGAFLPTAYVGIAELGVIAAIGMAVALVLALTLLPALVVLLAPAAPAGAVDLGWAGADAALARRRRVVLGAFVLALVASIALLPRVVFDFNPLHLRDPHSPAMRALADLTRDPDRTPNTIEVLAPDAAAARALAGKLNKLIEVHQVVSLDSFVPVDQPAKLATISDAATLLDLTLSPFDVAPSPDDAARAKALSAAAAQLNQAYLRVVCGAPTQVPPPAVRLVPPCDTTRAPVGPEAAAARAAERLAVAFGRLAAGTPGQRAAFDAALSAPLAVMLAAARASLQAQPVTAATLPPELRRVWVAPDGRELLQVFPAGDAADNATLTRFRAAVARVTPAISGLPVATEAAASTVAGAFVQAGVIAFALVSLLLFAVLRDVREVLFTLAPVVLSIFLTLGTCVVIGQPVNFANIIAFPLLFGVGVAFHIYFVMAWRAGTARLLGSSLARGVLFSALATGTAFGSLWLSHHPGTASMGKILLISLAWTLVCALVFEPALLGPPRERRA